MASQSVSASEVSLTNGLALQKLLARALQHDFSTLKDVGAVRHRQRHRRILLDDQHAGTQHFDLANDLVDLVDRVGASPIEGSSIGLASAAPLARVQLPPSAVHRLTRFRHSDAGFGDARKQVDDLRLDPA